MISTKLLRSIVTVNKSWLTSAAVAVLALVVSSDLAIAEKPNRSNIPSPSGKIAGEVYLYGETDVPNVVGKEYIIFETVGNQTIGAFYLPQSEFSCFSGRFSGAKLNITLVDSYDNQKYKYSLALNPSGLTASKQPMMGAPTYQPLGKISDNDRKILNTCKLQLQGKV